MGNICLVHANKKHKDFLIYANKVIDQVNDMKEQKIQMLLTYVKKKIKDEGIISNRRKNELLKRFLNNLMKDKMNKLLFAFKIWDKIARVLKEEKKPLFREVDGGILTTINGEEKLIDGKDMREGGEINIKLIKNKDGKFTIEDIVNNTLTEKERQEIIQKKMPETIELIDDKKKSLLQKKLYQWKNNAKKITCNENANVIQKFLGKKFGEYLMKKRANFFANLAKNYLINSILNAAKVSKLDNILRNIFYKRFLDNLNNNNKKINSITSFSDNIIKANNNLNEQNQKIAVEKLLKIYTYVVLKKLFEKITKIYKRQQKGSMKDLLMQLKAKKHKKSEYSYGNKLSSERKSISRKLSFSSKKSPKRKAKNVNESIPYISLVPYLIKYLEGKINDRKNMFYQKLKTLYRNKKLCDLLDKYVSEKESPDKEFFFETVKKTAQSGPMKVKLYKLFRKKVIKKMFSEIVYPSRILKLMYLMKLTIVSKEISEKRWIRVLIRKWRFISFSKNISKKKMAFLYKHLHVNYLEMVNDVFGEEEKSNPSVIKEFERFGANVGMWENEHPDFVEESNFCKNVQKRFSFHAPSGINIRNLLNEQKKIKEVKEMKEEELLEKKEIKKMDKKDDEKDDEEDEKEEDEKEDDQKEVKEQTPGKKRYYRKTAK